jgi:hypothetical protein
MLTQSSMLWAKLDLHQTNHVLDDRLAMRFIQRARPYLQHLNLRQCSRIGRLTFLGKSQQQQHLFVYSFLFLRD